VKTEERASPASKKHGTGNGEEYNLHPGTSEVPTRILQLRRARSLESMWARHLRGIVTRVYRKLDFVHYWKTAMAAPLRVLDGVGTARRG
jgi:hypothetical protein